jgi:hypothetical protein
VTGSWEEEKLSQSIDNVDRGRNEPLVAYAIRPHSTRDTRVPHQRWRSADVVQAQHVLHGVQTRLAPHNPARCLARPTRECHAVARPVRKFDALPDACERYSVVTDDIAAAEY